MEVQPTNKGVLILDIPVPHKGYVDLLRSHADGSIEKLYLVGEDLLATLELPREIRANDPETTRRMLLGLELPFKIGILDSEGVSSLPSSGIYTARDLVSRRLRERYFSDAQVTEEDVFLRWDANNVSADRPSMVDEETADPFHVAMMRRARELSDNSSDWWRRVGVVAVRDGQILLEAYNQALPTDNKPYIDGNPRDHTIPGTLGSLVSTVHAEQALTAKAAARLDISLSGTDVYLNSFPCPPCATSLGLAGISRCFTDGGNAYLDAAETLKALGIKTFSVIGE